MADHSPIEWTDATWNPIVGCSITSPGCTNCYAMSMARRIEAMQPGSHYAGTTQVVNGNPVWTGKVAPAPEHILTQPLRWRRPRRIFVNSMGDLFHEDVPDEWIDRAFAVMALAPHHTYQVLTKRSARMRTYIGLPGAARKARNAVLRDIMSEILPNHGEAWALQPRNRHIWLGISAEDQRNYDQRREAILDLAGGFPLFVSAEPLVGPLDLRFAWDHCDLCGGTGILARWPKGKCYICAGKGRRLINGGPSSKACRTFSWVIVGGESGPRARPMHPDWARSLRDQCAAAGVPFFFKQWGSWAPRRGAKKADLFDARKTQIVRHDGGTTSGLMAYDETAWVMDHVGKRASGRVLDGVEHDGMPEVRP